MTLYKCNECKLEFKTNSGLWKHNKNYHLKVQKEKTFNCKYCYKKLANRHSLWHHENKVCYKKYMETEIEIKFVVPKVVPEVATEVVPEVATKVVPKVATEVKTEVVTEVATEVDTKLDLYSDNSIELPLGLSNNKKYNKNKKHNYIYLIEKYDVNNEETIYKFGKSTRNIYERLKEHGKEAKIILVLEVDNCNIIEKKILNILNNNKIIIQKTHIGTEYFSCINKTYIKQLISKNAF